jgi:hypothetical protein
LSTAPQRYQSGIPFQISLPSVYVTPWHKTAASNSACVNRIANVAEQFEFSALRWLRETNEFDLNDASHLLPASHVSAFEVQWPAGLPDEVFIGSSEPLSLFATI